MAAMLKVALGFGVTVLLAVIIWLLFAGVQQPASNLG